MAGVLINDSVTNQTGVPMVFALPFASFPAAGVPFRIGFRTDAPYGIYMDNGSAFVLIAQTSSGGTISGSGTAGTLPIFSAATVLGDSLITQSSGNINLTAAVLAVSAIFSGIIQASAIKLTGASAGNGALYWTSDRVTVANYNALGLVQIEANGGVSVAVFGGAVYNNDFVGSARFTGALTGTTADFTGVLTLGSTINKGAFVFTLPGSSGTLALTSALAAYLPLAGGTLTGGLTGTTADFTGVLTLGSTINKGAFVFTLPGSSGTLALTSALAAYLPLAGGTLTGGLTGTTASMSLGSSAVPTAANSAFYPSASTSNTGYAGTYYDGSTAYSSFFGRVPSSISSINDGLGYITISGVTPTLRVLFSNSEFKLNVPLSGTSASFSGALDVTNTIRTDGTSNSILLRNGFTATLRNPNPSTRDFQIEGDAVTATFKGAGNVLIGTTTDAGFKLDVNGASRVIGNLTVGNQTANATLKIYADTGGGDAYLKFNADSDQTKAQIYGHKFAGTGGILEFSTLQSSVLTTVLTLNQTGAATFAGTLGINGTADNVKSGTYTPTAVNISNTSARSAYLAQYMRIGNVVTVSGQALITTVAVGVTEISLTLPITSNFATSIQASGTANNDGTAGIITSIASTTTVSLKFTSPGALSLYLFVYQYSYQVI